MNFISLVGVEFKKIRRSKISLILLIPVIIMWIPSIINSGINFDTRDVRISPENNFFIQGFMGMVWFMIPAILVICTVLLTQTERSNKGILKMLSLPVNTAKLCLAKFTVLLLMALTQMVMTIAAYYISAAIASYIHNYNFFTETCLCLPDNFEYLRRGDPDGSGILDDGQLDYCACFLDRSGTCQHCALCIDNKHKNLVSVSDELSLLSADGRIWKGGGGNV